MKTTCKSAWPHHSAGARLLTSGNGTAKLCHKTTDWAAAVRYFWLVLMNRSLLPSVSRCWELITSMNIWWIIRSLILLAVVVIFCSFLLLCCSWISPFKSRCKDWRLRRKLLQILLKTLFQLFLLHTLEHSFSTCGLWPKRGLWTRSGWVTDSCSKKGHLTLFWCWTCLLFWRAHNPCKLVRSLQVCVVSWWPGVVTWGNLNGDFCSFRKIRDRNPKSGLHCNDHGNHVVPRVTPVENSCNIQY